jgi:translation initiation factor IF-2
MKRMMRAAAVAKHIGISSQELRKMLSEVNFGIKPTDREFPETIASGVVRFAARKFKKNIPPLVVHQEESESDPEEVLPQEDSVTIPQTKQEETAFEKLSRLGKRRVEEPKKEEKTIEDEKKDKESPVGSPAIFRKIEVDPKEAEAIKKAHEKEKKSKQEREQEVLEKRVMERRRKKTPELIKKEGIIEIPASISIKEFSEKVGVPAGEIITILMKNGMMVTMTQTIDFDTLSIVAEEIDVQISKKEQEASAKDLKERNLDQLIHDETENMEKRPAVVVVMGHVDHGKTKILDAIRETRVAEGEAGGITQHIGAYQVEKNNQKITFLDTPGHEAFTAMRARGTKTADIAILVVAADEGIKPQTKEAISHALEAKLPIIVAINKVDKPEANIETVKGELASHNLTPEDWGGEIITVPVSALKGEGIDALLDVVLLSSEMLELKANPNRLAVGTIIESNLDASLGPVATVLINTGTLRVGDSFILGKIMGKVKTMVNDEGKRVQLAPPGMPVRISGLSRVPSTGEILQVFPDAKTAREKAEEFALLEHEDKNRASLSEIMAGLQQGKIKFLKIVLKADTEGSLEAVKQAIEKIESNEVLPKVIHSAVGGVTETDVMMATASCGIVLGFNAGISPRIKRIAERERVEIQNYNIIYKLIDDVKDILSGLLEPEIVETVIGNLQVKQVFYTKKKMMIVGGKVTDGYLKNGVYVRIFRRADQEETLIGTSKISSLQHFEKRIPRIEENQECGIQLEGKIVVEEGDRIEAYTKEERIKTL